MTGGTWNLGRGNGLTFHGESWLVNNRDPYPDETSMEDLIISLHERWKMVLLFRDYLHWLVFQTGSENVMVYEIIPI